jgi:hypothetical protein
VNNHTPSTPDGLGATTNGCRPISVKIQPKLLPRNGVAMLASASRGNQRVLGTRSPRVSHSTAMPASVPSAPSPIISRKLQYVTGRFGT